MKQRPQNESFSSQNQSNWLAKQSKNNRKYSRITTDVKDRLVFLIVRNNMSIKQASQEVDINYSSAKFIFNQYRYKNQKNVNTCITGAPIVVRKLTQKEEDVVQVRCTVGGKFEYQSSRPFTALQVQRRELGAQLDMPDGKQIVQINI